MVHLCNILPILCIINIIQYVQANNTSIPNYYNINNGLSLKKSFRELFQTSSACSNEPIPVTEKQRNVTVNFTSTEKPSSGNCTNNLTDPSAITTGASVTESEPSSDEPSKQPIVTFDEWTKEKLKQEQRKAAPAPATPTPDVRPPTPTRNYASKECGAKILLTNAEAENSKAILNDKEQDEYMRNPCNKADSKFIIVELCETIQPQQIILGNSELFSSGPKDIRIFAAERTGGDWIPIGNFTAADNRQLQTFSIENRQYAKLLKIELLSHYGSEHYCTLSVLKVMGSSIVDEYEYEAHLATVEPAKPSISSQSEDPSAAIIKPQEESELKEEVEKNNDKPKEIAEIKENNVVVAKKYKPFDISLCKVCTISPSCIVPIHLCWVFVWRPPPKNTTVFPTTSLALPARRLFSEKRRRRRIAFHQRQMFKKKEAVILPAILKPEVKAVVEIVEEEKQEELVTTSPPIIQPAANEALPAASVSHKESVFMKLNKRIAALELNMSLSSEYLSELSRQYVAQTDEHKKHLEQARKTAQEVAEGVELRLNHTIAERLSLMRKEMDSLAEWLHSMRLTASELSISQFSWQVPQRDKCSSDDTTAVKHYIHIEDLPSANWTLSEAVILAIVAQIFTVFFGGLAIYYMNRKKQTVVDSELEKLIQLKVEEILEAKMAQSAHPSINKKKRKKRNRPVNHLNYPPSDSAASQSTTASQTETSSEAESSKVNLPSQIQSCVDQEERSEEERPWVSVKRKNSK